MKSREAQTLKRRRGGGLSRGEGATSPNSSPSPLDEKEKEILKNSGILEVKAKDFEKLDSESETPKIQEAKTRASQAIVSESKGRAKSTMAGDSEKVDLESATLKI